ncbi:MAG: hypothetical protein U5L11_14915 [Arhodomonas sp.]|nr:hypothetical protein [Arhodomonas sp.]
MTRELVGPLAEHFRTRADSPEGEAAAEAHFFHAFMRNKLGARLHHQGARARGPRLVAAGLPGECTETALLLFCLEATAYDYRIVLLGGDMPLRPIPHVARRTDARGIFLFGEGDHAADIEESLQELVAAAPCPVAVAGAVAAQRRPAVERAGAHALPEAASAGIGAIRNLLRSGC